jgi:uncharacterized protein YbjT (DUF2867 family)
MKRTALLAGATGLVGSRLLQLLAQGSVYSTVHVLARRSFPSPAPHVEVHRVDFGNLEAWNRLFAVDDIFCAIGTTMRSAGSRKAFEAVDLGIPAGLARLGAAGGARRFLMISSLGADPSSPVFYSRVKGKAEEAVSAFPFEAIHLFRPSLLLGERRETRTGERLAALALRTVGFAMVGPLKKYAPIQAETVARAMAACAVSQRRGVNTYESDIIAMECERSLHA